MKQEHRTPCWNYEKKIPTHTNRRKPLFKKLRDLRDYNINAY